MAQQQQQQQQGQRMQRGNFLADTRQAFITQPPIVPAQLDTAGIFSTQQLPTSGYLSGIWMILSVTVVTTSAGSNAALAYPKSPLGLVRKIRVYNNMGTDIWNTSGFGAYKAMKHTRTAFDPTQAFGLSYAATDDGDNNTVQSRYFNSPATQAVSTTVTYRFPFYLQTSFGSMGQAGLQLLQDDAVKWFIEVTWGGHADIFSTFGTGASITATSIQPVYETFSTPRNPANRPNLSYSLITIEENQAFDTGAGLNTYKFVTGNMVTRLIQWFENGTAPVKPLDPDQFTLMQMNYGSTQVPYNVDTNVQALIQRWRYAMDMEQGQYTWDLATALGLPEIPTLRDVIDTIQLTNLQTQFTLTNTTPSGSNFRTVKQMLSPNRRF